MIFGIVIIAFLSLLNVRFISNTVENKMNLMREDGYDHDAILIEIDGFAIGSKVDFSVELIRNQFGDFFVFTESQYNIISREIENKYIWKSFKNYHSLFSNLINRGGNFSFSIYFTEKVYFIITEVNQTDFIRYRYEVDNFTLKFFVFGALLIFAASIYWNYKNTDENEDFITILFKKMSEKTKSFFEDVRDLMEIDDGPKRFISFENAMKFLMLSAIALLVILSIIYDDGGNFSRIYHLTLAIPGCLISWKFFHTQKKVSNWYILFPAFILISSIILITRFYDTPDRNDIIRVLVAPFTEEVFFRGIMIAPARKTDNKFVKVMIVLLSSLLFKYTHMQY